MEEWRDIKGYEGIYQVSNLGRIKSLERKVKTYYGERLKKEKILKPSYDKDKYLRVNLQGCPKKVHRLVAETFIENVDNKDTVNHINGVKNDNRIENLEWSTMKEQVIHRHSVLGIPYSNMKACQEAHRKKVRRSDGMIFNSMTDASKGDEKLRKRISDCCRGKSKSAGGYFWEYVN